MCINHVHLSLDRLMSTQFPHWTHWEGVVLSNLWYVICKVRQQRKWHDYSLVERSISKVTCIILKSFYNTWYYVFTQFKITWKFWVHLYVWVWFNAVINIFWSNYRFSKINWKQILNNILIHIRSHRLKR